MKRFILIFMMCVATTISGYAQSSTKVETKVNELVKKYENVKGVDCVTVKKGSGLGIVKMMLNNEFGKDFMAGVTSITIINYTDASQSTCLALRKEFDLFGFMLEDFNMGENEDFKEYDYARCYAAISGSNTISDFMIAMEDSDAKMMMYMAGKIKIE